MSFDLKVFIFNLDFNLEGKILILEKCLTTISRGEKEERELRSRREFSSGRKSIQIFFF